MNQASQDAPSHVYLALAVLFALIVVAAAADLVMDRPQTLWSLHVLAEGAVVLLSLGAASWLAWGWFSAMRDVRRLEQTVAVRQAERDEWRLRAGRVLQGLAEAMSEQFAEWGLTDAERETALMLLKGYSHKRIGKLTNRSERTARQHAVAVYRKSGLAGRSELSAFFLEDLLLPATARSDAQRNA